MVGVRYSRSAQVDLLDAWLFIAEENPAAADRLLEIIEREVRVLLDQPLLGRARPELGESVRSWSTSTPYVLFYLADEKGISVIRVLHHARDFQQIDF